MPGEELLVPLQSARRERRGRVIRAAALFAVLASAACEKAPPPGEPEGPVPALSQVGLAWSVSKGDKPVFTMKNEPGRIRWKAETKEHPFVSGALVEPREEERLRRTVKRSRHFRDLINQLQLAGYGVAPASPPPP